MAISFSDSLHTARNGSDPEAMLTSVFGETEGDIYTADSWTLDERYSYYPEYYDNSISTIDANKNINLDGTQINLTQEANSQFIPFEMPRYYDGFDLLTTNILIHFVNKEMYEDYDSPINLYYAEEKIKFGWLVDSRVTAIDGIVKFEIQAIGTNSLGEEYVWKTKPSSGLNILKSLEGNGVIEPDSTWLTNLILQVKSDLEKTIDEKVAQYVDESLLIDATLTQEGQAADAKAVGDRFEDLPISIAEDGYTDIENTRKILSGDFVKTDETIIATFNLSGGKTSTSVINFNSSGYPSQINTNGYVCELTFTGFELTENEAAAILDEINGEVIE